MGKFKDEPDSAAFPIGAGCTQNLRAIGRTRRLRQRPAGGLCRQSRRGDAHRRSRAASRAGPADAIGGLSGWWRDVVDIFNRTAGVPVIAAFALGVSGILLLMPQGRDLVRGVGEDGLGRVGDRFRDRASVLRDSGLELVAHRHRLELRNRPRPAGARAGSSNGGRGCWPSCLLPRPRIALTGQFQVERARRPGSCWRSARSFSLLVVFRQPITRRLVGHTETAPWIQGAWVIAGLAMALGAMVVAILWPAGIGVGLGAPGDRFLRARLHHSRDHDRLPARHEPQDPGHGALLLWAVLLGVFFDNHQVGRRALVAETGGPTERPTLESAFKQWADRPARRPQRQEDDGPRRRAGRRVASRLLDGRRALEPAAKRPRRRKAVESTRISSPSVRCRAEASARSATPRC